MQQLRKDPIIGRWVIISAERARRPNDFHLTQQQPRGGFCPFCEGNEDKTPPEIMALRNAGTAPNTPGWHLRVVPNKFPALQVEGDLGRRGQGIFDIMNGIGAHEVIIESPKHILNITELDWNHTEKILSAYQERIADLKKDTRLRYILVFKNFGEQAGASLEHSHSQIIATPVTPKRVKEELWGTRKHYIEKERCIFCDIIHQEQEYNERIIDENEHFICLAPFASRFPFESWILPKRHSCDYNLITKEEVTDLALMLQTLMKKLALLLNNPPYNYVLHTAPNRTQQNGYWDTIDKDYHWHIEIMPRITRIAGFEWGTGFYINPTPPEEAARFLRETEI